jgi:hypothetical protein
VFAEVKAVLAEAAAGLQSSSVYKKMR